MTRADGARAQVIDRSSRLLDFLSAVARDVGPETVRDARRHEITVWSSDVGEHRAVAVGSSDDRAEWLRVRRVPAPPAVVVPSSLSRVVDMSTTSDPRLRPKLRPAALEWVARELAERQISERASQASALEPIDDIDLPAAVARRREELESSFSDWLEHDWRTWSTEHGPTVLARVLYNTLYELHLRADAEQDRFQVVWGHAVMSVLAPSKGPIVAPLLTAPMVLEVDPDDGTIRVRPEKPSELELDAIEGVGLSGLEGLATLRDRLRDDPVDPWSDAERLAFRRQLIAPLGGDAELSSSDAVAPTTNAPIVNDGWVLMLRKRPLRQERFYDELAETLRETGRVPDALASVVADSELVDAAVRAEGSAPTADDGTADRLLMPLPANDDQERIARQIARSRGVTVQGPPGTGKSHTIVNLVSHLVAQGRRVLVTAQNDQALGVLRDKIPAELRDLSIAVLGSTPAAMEELRSSAQAMQDSLSSLDVDRADRRLAELGAQIDSLRDDLRRADLALVEALRSETREYPLPIGSRRAPEVAAWVADHRSVESIPDDVPAHSVPPLSASELREFATLSASVSSDDAQAARLKLPLADWLPPTPEFGWLVEAIGARQQTVTELESQGLRISAVDSWKGDDLGEVARVVAKGAADARELSGAWETRLAEAVSRSDPRAQYVVAQNDLVRSKVAEVAALARGLAGHDVSVPVGNPAIQLPLLEQWRARLASGKKLPMMGWREVKDLDQTTRVDGYAVVTAEQVSSVIAMVRLRAAAAQLHRLAADAYASIGVPLPEVGPTSYLALDVLVQRVDAVQRWWSTTYPSLNTLLSGLVDHPAPAGTAEGLDRAHRLLLAASARREERTLTARLDELGRRLAQHTAEDGASALWGRLLSALQNRSIGDWDAALLETARLSELRVALERRNALEHRLSSGGAPRWARRIVESAGDASLNEPDELAALWTASAARTWLAQLHLETDVAALMARAHESSVALQAAILAMASISARLQLKRNTKDRHRRALETWLTAIRRVGKGTGKNAPRYQAQARAALPQAMGSVPVWIMPIYRVMENFDPRESEPFDVVIVDESSQCDLLSLGVMALGAKTVVVGDDKQTSPMAVGVDTNRIFDLQRQMVNDLPDKALLTMDESLYSLSSRAFPSTILLREHFRCVPEIINYSNRFYDGKIMPLREVTVPEIGEPLRAVRVADGASDKVGTGRVNRREAEVLVETVAACASDPAYDGLTFGVVTLMSGPQGPLIERLLVERLGALELERRHLRVGNPPVFQGDERNVVFISVVADDNSYAWTRQNHQQWANVAVSRAQDQLWVFHTVDPATLHHEDQRRHLIEYVSDGGKRPGNTDLFELTESKFEADVLRQILERGYDVTPQHKVGSFRIDFVVTVGDGERLAVECDGDSFHGPDKWDDDVRRQRVLERLGWTFWRVRASEYYLDPEAALASLWNRLEHMRRRADDRAANRRRALDRAAEEARELTERAEREAARDAERVAQEEDSAEEVLAPTSATEVPESGAAGSLNRPGLEPAPIQAERSGTGQPAVVVAGGPYTSSSVIRQWARSQGIPVGDRGRIAPDVKRAYFDAQQAPDQTEGDGASTRLSEPTGPVRAWHSLANPVGLKHSSAREHNGSSYRSEAPARDDSDDNARPSPALLFEVWRVGHVFQMDHGGDVRPRGGGDELRQVVGLTAGAGVVAAMQRVRPEGGRFKVDSTGVLVTIVAGVPTFVAWVSPTTWYPWVWDGLDAKP